MLLFVCVSKIKFFGIFTGHMFSLGQKGKNCVFEKTSVKAVSNRTIRYKTLKGAEKTHEDKRATRKNCKKIQSL